MDIVSVIVLAVGIVLSVLIQICIIKLIAAAFKDGGPRGGHRVRPAHRQIAPRPAPSALPVMAFWPFQSPRKQE